jgi:cyclase
MRNRNLSFMVRLSLLVFFTAVQVPLSAQVLLAGEWVPRTHEDQPERGPGPFLGDYLGLPINDAARQRAESWDASRLTLQEHQCRVHISPYIYRGPLALRIWEEKDPFTQQVVAIKNYISTYEQTRTIWMDGRPHPSEFAPHTWMGFSTGKWEGNILTVYTTHIKQGWLRRNGLPESDYATMTEHFIRHGDYFTHMVILDDPVYLAEPMVKTEDFALNINGGINWLWPCEYVLETNAKPRGVVPHYLPGKNPFLQEFYDFARVTSAAASGGPETMYPEFRADMNKRSAARARTPEQPRMPKVQKPGEVEILPVQGNVYLIAGAGGNIAVQIGEQGVLMVDTGSAAMPEKVLAAVRSLAPGKPIRYILNTHVHPDHTGGNEYIAKQVGSVAKVAVVNTPGSTAFGTVQILANENVLARMDKADNGLKPYPVEAWPTETYIDQIKELFFNKEAIEMFHHPTAHTDGDSYVYFRRSDVLATGDVFTPTNYPVIDLLRGGTVQGVIDSLNHLLDLAIPEHHQEGGTMIIPGHGRICDEADLVEYRDMVVIVRDRIQDMIKRNMTLEQIKAARPTLDYDPLYGATSGPWTTDNFVEAVYKNLVVK